MESTKLIDFRMEMSAKEFTVSIFEFYNHTFIPFFVFVSCHFQSKYGFFIQKIGQPIFSVFGHFEEEWNDSDNGLLII